MQIIDTHCHLHFDDYDTDRQEVLKASAAAGVNRLICVGCSLEDSRKAIDFAAQTPGVWAAAGAHPHDGKGFIETPNAAIKLQKMLTEPKVVAVGEIGLDYYRDFTPKDVQEKILRIQLEVGLESGLRFIFHVREAWEGFWPVFDSHPGITGVIHSFSANEEQLDQALSRGLYIALNGIMTFTKDESWLAAAKKVPLDKLLLETDAPFLAPVPHRGHRNEPGYTADTCRFLAQLRDEDPEKIAQATTANAVKLFGLGQELIT